MRLSASLVVVLAWCTTAHADPFLRTEMTVNGDSIVVGNTMGRECQGAVPAPVVGTFDCDTGMPDPFGVDTAPDIFWRADDPLPGQARAGWDIEAADARVTSVLHLPPNASVRHARLYWASLTAEDDGEAGAAITLERPDVFSTVIAAESSAVGERNASGRYFYQSSADVSLLVATHGVGAYRASNFKMRSLNRGEDVDEAFAGFWLFVVYEVPGAPQRHIALFEGTDQVDTTRITSCDPDDPGTEGVCITVSGFLIPPGDPASTVNAKMTMVTYEGDFALSGDKMQFRPLRAGPTAYTDLGNGPNSATNFFNGSSTFFGQTVSDLCSPANVATLPAAARELGAAHCNAGALPQLSGAPFSGSGMDIDVFNLSGLGLVANDTQARFRATTTQDFYVLSGFTTSFASLSPNFLQSTKTVSTAPKAANAVVPGDVVRYTITLKNTGNDGATGVSVSDVLDARLAMVPGSLLSGPAADALVAAGTYDALTRTLTVSVGDVAMGGTWLIQFDATVQAGATGVVPNIATITASGESGAPESTYQTSGVDSPRLYETPVPLPVAECDSDDDCDAPTPHCAAGSEGPPLVLNHCSGCGTDADCSGTTPICGNDATCAPCTSDAQCAEKDPNAPYCAPTGECGACNADDATRCTTGECRVDVGQCACSIDAECGARDSGKVCEMNTCIDGCAIAKERNYCPADLVCSRVDGEVGVCIGRGCSQSSDCSANPAGGLCDVGVCSCHSDADCGLNPGGPCDIETATCSRAIGDGGQAYAQGGRVEGGGLFQCASGSAGLFEALLSLFVALRLRRRR